MPSVAADCLYPSVLQYGVAATFTLTPHSGSAFDSDTLVFTDLDESNNSAGGTFSNSGTAALGTGASLSFTYTPSGAYTGRSIKFTVSSNATLSTYRKYFVGSPSDPGLTLQSNVSAGSSVLLTFTGGHSVRNTGFLQIATDGTHAAEVANVQTSGSGQAVVATLANAHNAGSVVTQFFVAKVSKVVIPAQKYAPVKRVAGLSTDGNGGVAGQPPNFAIPPGKSLPSNGKFGSVFYVGEPIVFYGCLGAQWQLYDAWNALVTSGTVSSGVVTVPAQTAGHYHLHLWQSGTNDASFGDAAGVFDFLVANTALHADIVERSLYWGAAGVFAYPAHSTHVEDPTTTHALTDGIFPRAVRYSGFYHATDTGTHTWQCSMSGSAGGGVRLIINGVTLFDRPDLTNVTDTQSTGVTITNTLASGVDYPIEIVWSPGSNTAQFWIQNTTPNGVSFTNAGSGGFHGTWKDAGGAPGGLTGDYLSNVAVTHADASVGTHSEISGWANSQTTRLTIECTTNPDVDGSKAVAVAYCTRRGTLTDTVRPHQPIVAFRYYAGGYNAPLTGHLGADASSGQPTVQYAVSNGWPVGQFFVGAVVDITDGTNTETKIIAPAGINIGASTVTFTTNLAHAYAVAATTIIVNRAAEAAGVAAVVAAVYAVCPNAIFESYNEPLPAQAVGFADNFYADVKAGNAAALVGGPAFVGEMGNASGWDTWYSAGKAAKVDVLTGHFYDTPEIGSAIGVYDQYNTFGNYLGTKADPLNAGHTLAQRAHYITENGYRLRFEGLAHKTAKIRYRAQSVFWGEYFGSVPRHRNVQWTPNDHGDLGFETGFAGVTIAPGSYINYWQSQGDWLADRVFGDMIYGTAVTPAKYNLATLGIAGLAGGLHYTGTSLNGNKDVSVFLCDDPDLTLTLRVTGGSGNVQMYDWAGNDISQAPSCGAIQFTAGLPVYLVHQTAQTFTPLGVDWGTNIALTATSTVSGSATSKSLINDGIVQTAGLNGWGSTADPYRDNTTGSDDNPNLQPSDFPFKLTYDHGSAVGACAALVFNSIPFRGAGSTIMEAQWKTSTDNITFTPVGTLLDKRPKFVSNWFLQNTVGSTGESGSHSLSCRAIQFPRASARYRQLQIDRTGFGFAETKVEDECGGEGIEAMPVPVVSLGEVALYNPAVALSGDVTSITAGSGNFTVHLLAVNSPGYTGGTVFTTPDATIVTQANVDSTHQSVTITAPSSAGTITLTGPNGETYSITVNASAATGVIRSRIFSGM